MKRFFYSALCLSALALTFSCEKPDNGGNNGGGDGTPTKLATPQLTSTTTSDSFTITWGAVENATGYTVLFNDAEESITETTYTKTVEPGAYIVKVKATSTDTNYEASDWAEITVVVESGSTGGEIEGDGTWFGTWRVSYDKTVVFDSSATTLEDEAGELNVEMMEGDQAGQTYIYGWSQLTFDDGSSVPGLAISLEGMEGAETDNPNDLGFFSGIEIAQAGDLVATWLGYAEYDGSYTIVSGQYPALTLDINDDFNAATGVHYVGELQNGGSFEAIGLEVFGVDPNDSTQIYFFIEAFPAKYPAGNYSLVKTANASSAERASIASKTISNVNAVAATSVVAR